MMDKSQAETKQAEKKKLSLTKVIFILSGFLCLGLGTAGIVLPILPTVPLYLATAYFFAKGSEKFDRWFTDTKLYKKHLENFVKNRTITMEKEVLLLTAVPALLVFSMVMLDSLALYIAVPLIIAVIYSYFFSRIKTIDKFKARPSSRLIALLLCCVMIAAMIIFNSAVMYTVFSILSATNLLYFTSAKTPAKQTA